MINHINVLIEHYGYLGIILALIGGIVGLPIPDEVLLTYVGFNVFQEKISFIPSLISAWIGSMTGITLSYYLGKKLGLPFLHKFGPKFHITEGKIIRAKSLFNKFGPFLLFIGYFIPGVRHITAYLAGINSYPFERFVIFAYSGAFLWSFTFITAGKVLGENWHTVGTLFTKLSFPLVLLIVLASITYAFIWRKNRK